MALNNSVRLVYRIYSGNTNAATAATAESGSAAAPLLICRGFGMTKVRRTMPGCVAAHA